MKLLSILFFAGGVVFLILTPRGALGWYFGRHYFELGPSRKQQAIGTIRRE
jgi:hypothetical protein